MGVVAVSKYIRQSPRKVSLVVSTVRGLPLEEALARLTVSVKKASLPVSKVILSAVANAENNYGFDRARLKIKEIQVSPGPTLRRANFRARGRMDVIRKRSSHVRVVLEGEGGVVKAGRAAPLPDLGESERKEKERRETEGTRKKGEAEKGRRTKARTGVKHSSAKTTRRTDRGD